MDPSAGAPDPSAPHAGQVVAGRYRLLAPVGAGGLASVWEAEHITLRSRYAVKFLHQTGPADGEPAQRFLREARIAASVKQRNVLEIVDFGFMDGDPGASERGVPYMVMELLKGRSLGALLAAEGKLDVRRAVDIAGGVLRGLAAVHAAGLLHRDVKPHNVFLVEDEDGAFPKLVDFGLSRRTGRSDLTLEGTMLGTPLYMAPEQVAARGDLDARVDIYAMGVMLYEMLAGAPPFNAPTITEILHLVVFAAPPPLAEKVPGIPPALALVVETAMQKTRELRYADARAMRSALLDAMSAGTTTASGPLRVSTPDQGVRKLERAIERPVERAVEAATTAEVPPQIQELEPEPPPPPHAAPRESSFLVFVRASVLLAIAIGVAVLVLDGPWTEETEVPTPSVVSGGDGGALALVLPDASESPTLPSADAAFGDDAGSDAALDDAALNDAALDDAANEEDAAVEIDAALEVDAGLDAASEPEPEVADAGSAAGPRRTVTPTRRTRPGRTAHPPRTTRRHPSRTTTHRRRTTRTRRPR